MSLLSNIDILKIFMSAEFINFMLRIRKIFTIKFFVLLILLFSNQLYSSSQGALLTVRVEIFEEVWSIIDEKYYDANFNGVDWKEVKKHYRPLIEKAKSEDEFYALLDRMAGELNDSHTRVFSPKRRVDREKKRSSSVGIEIGKIENKFVVTRILPNSLAEITGLKAGMIVNTVQGKPVATSFAEALTEVGASSSERSATMRAFSKMFSGDPAENLRLELEGTDGKTIYVELPRRSFSNESDFEAKLLSSGIAYLKFGEFEKETPDKVLEFLKKYGGSKGMILDLRGNGGGDGEAGLSIAGYFLENKIAVARLITRTGKPPIPEIPMLLEAGTSGGQIYSKPIVILVDQGTASTSELITNALQENKRAYIIGAQTCGCVLGFLGYRKIKGGGDMSLSEFGFVTAKGKTLEGNGVTPDKIVLLTLENLRNDRDAALLEAEKYLKSSENK